jgi:hypothetical protein
MLSLAFSLVLSPLLNQVHVHLSGQLSSSAARRQFAKVEEKCVPQRFGSSKKNNTKKVIDEDHHNYPQYLRSAAKQVNF